MSRGEAKLSATERTFFESVQRAAFSNPFGPDRETQDRTIYAGSRRQSTEERLQGVLQTVARRLQTTLPQRRRWKEFGEADRACLRSALLYEKLGNYERVAQRAGLDRRTAAKYVNQALSAMPLPGNRGQEKIKAKDEGVHALIPNLFP